MQTPAIEMKGITKIYPNGVVANKDVDFSVDYGEIHAVMGENGAGKSTLMKMLFGLEKIDKGEVLFEGRPVRINSPAEAINLKIGMVHQEFMLVPSLTVSENMMLREEPKKGIFINRAKAVEETRRIARMYQLPIDPDTRVEDLPVGMKQRVEILKALYRGARILILDEPTAVLTPQETEELFRIVQHLHKTENIAILFISHRLNEILEICENYTVMRNGKIIDTTPVTGQTTTKEIVEKMLGRAFEENFPKEACEIGEMLFETLHLSGARGKVKDVSIQVKSGEVVGIAGLVGAGKSELCKTLFGAFKMTDGKIMLKGRELKIANPSGAVKNRMALVPEERRKEGVLVHENVSFNLSAACLSRFCTGPFIRGRRVDANAKRYVEDLGISTPSVRQQVKNLSGGNQQKVAVGKWLAADCDIYIFDEPTKGVDVGAKQDIFHLINQIAKQGHGVIYASCENSELLSLTDRMYVMYNGTVMAELETAKTTEDEIMYYSVGGTDNKNRIQ